MATLSYLKIISTLSNVFQNTSFTLFPISFIPNQNAFRVSTNKSAHRSKILLFHILNLIIFVTQFVFNLFFCEQRSLLRVIFYGFVLLLATATGIYGFGYYNRAAEFSCLLNFMFCTPKEIIRPKGGKHEIPLLVLILIGQITSFIGFLVFTPIVYLLFAFRDFRHISVPYFESGHITFISNMLMILIKIPTLYMGCMTAMLTQAILFVVVKELRDNLKQLQKLVEIRSDVKSGQIERYYRQIQIVTILVNDCLQMYFWPVVELYGSLTAIVVAYSFVRYHNLFNVFYQMSIIVMLFIELISIYFIFDVASQSLPLSSKIIVRPKLLPGKNEQNVLFRKFGKSCRPIVLKVGAFHKIDRQRGPGLMRFILQRTVFLLLKSEDR